jgi:hypothetical protein|tara:strand:+ start:590 stop:718 length:129 start_codon:yes stop_codon:yes gene_type:complete
MGEYNKVGILKEKNDIMLKRYNESKKIPKWKHLVNKIIRNNG